jgi:hypothetical protein
MLLLHSNNNRTTILFSYCIELLSPSRKKNNKCQISVCVMTSECNQKIVLELIKTVQKYRHFFANVITIRWT